MQFSNILIPTDFSEESISSIKYACTSILHFQQKITFMTVVEIWSAPNWPYTPDPDMQDSQVSAARTKLHAVASPYLKGYEVQEKVSLGLNPAEKICDVAKNMRCDLILMGSHGAGTLANLFIGSIVQRVIRLSTIPVLVLPRAIYWETI